MRIRALGCLLLVLSSHTFCAAEEPILGGPCENCELVFEGMPDQLEARSRIAPVEEPGEPLVVEGIVKRIDGTPAPGVIVYAYHTDATGIYPRAETLHGRLRGWARTDKAGMYRFDTIRPGSYPSGGNPAHIHMHVIEPGRGTYWIDDIHFDDDPILKQVNGYVEDRGGSGITHPERDKDGAWRVRRDINLGENIPGYK